MTKGNRIAAGATAAFIVFASSGAIAQDHNQRDDQNRQSDSRDRRGGDDQNHTRFDDHDEQNAREWYSQHQKNAPRGFRDREKLSNDDESRLREGATLDRNFRKQAQPLPSDLARRLARAPRGSKYLVIGGHVVMVNDHNQVQSVIHLNDNR